MLFLRKMELFSRFGLINYVRLDGFLRVRFRSFCLDVKDGKCLIVWIKGIESKYLL